MKVNCYKKGCKSTYEGEDVTPKTKYKCRLHDKPVEEIAFQEFQFDKGLRRARHPEGTNHIRNQGSSALTGDDPYNEHYRKDDE